MTSTIFVNGRFLTQPNTGVQRYAKEIIDNFDCLISEEEWAHDIRICCLVPPETSVKFSWKNISCESVGFNRGNLWEQLDLPISLRGEFLFSPANTGPILYTNQAITFHDASIFAVPHAYSFFFKLKYKLIFISLSRIAKVVFTDSKFSQTELSRYLKRTLDRFKVIHLAGNHIDRIQPDMETLAKYDLVKDGYVFTVGSQSPHKNLAAIYNAAKFINGNIKVVVAGGQYKKVFKNKVVQNNSENIVVLGYITDKELKSLYLNALGYIFPSFYEGFGLPILEAMQCGCPVLCAQAASLPEIAGEAALYFDPMKPNDLAKAVNRVFSDNQLRNDLIQKGYKRAEEFSWLTTAHKTLNALLDCTKEY